MSATINKIDKTTNSEDGFQLVSGKKNSKTQKNPSIHKIQITNKPILTKKCEEKKPYVSQYNEVKKNIIQSTVIPEQSKKRILCYNIVTDGKCPYGTNCLYAHSLSDQNIDPLRKKIYSLLTSNVLLNDIDIINDNEAYKVFLQLTRTCYGCANGKCPGGYNCKNGAISAKHTICYTDFQFGNCQNSSMCDKLHLTRRQFVPKVMQQMIMSDGASIDKTIYVDNLLSSIPIAKTIQEIQNTTNIIDTNINDDVSDGEQSDYSNESIDLSNNDTSETDSCDEFILTIYHTD